MVRIEDDDFLLTGQDSTILDISVPRPDFGGKVRLQKLILTAQVPEFMEAFTGW